MHPRNRYRKSPADFLHLSQAYPSLQPHIIQRTTEQCTIDFSNNRAVKELTKALLDQDFNLKWDIEEGQLVPTVPLRLNYLHWIEDLLSEHEGMVPKGPEVQGLDIGVGASCIYPILGVKMNKWTFYGTEKVASSLQRAEEIILRNELNANIRLAMPTDSSLMLALMEGQWRDVKLRFVMCNPPFYASVKEKTDPEDRTLHRLGNSTSQQECMLEECVTEGGELQFVKKIIEESLQLRNRVTWFTSMVGKKCHVNILLRVLQTERVPRIAQTVFVQGKTRRWGIAWSFDLHSSSWVQLIIPAIQKPLFLPIQSNKDGASVKMDTMLVGVLESLQLEVETYEGNKYICTAYKNTWSNQRKKRRMEKMREVHTNETFHEKEIVVGGKRTRPAADEVIEDKAMKVDGEMDSCLIEFLVEVKRGSDINKEELKKGLNEELVYLRFEALETSDKELLHQIMQYIKNNII